MNSINLNPPCSKEVFNPQSVNQIAIQPLMNSLLVPETRIETYVDLMMNLDQSEKAQLEREMEALPKNDKTINLDLVTKAIHSPDLEDSIWEHLQFPLYALLALKERKIDGMDFSTSQLFYNAMNHPNNKGQVKVIPLFFGSSYNPQAWQLIEETVEPFVSQYHEEKNFPADSPYVESYGLGRPFMTSKQIRIFFDMMARLHPLQRMFLLVPEPQPLSWKRNMELQENLRKGSVTEAINVKTPQFNVFCRVSDKLFKKPLRMIPSKGMMQAYIFATGGDCTLISQFRLSSFNYLEEGILQKERSMCLNFTFLPKISEADEYPCLLEVNEVEFHDFYHIDIMSLLKEDRKKFYGFAVLLQKILTKNSILAKNRHLECSIRNLHEFIVQMEAIPYREFISFQGESEKLPSEALFWASINDFLRVATSNNTDIFTIYEIIVSELSQNTVYCQFFGLNLDFLENFSDEMDNLIDPLEKDNFDCIQQLAQCYQNNLQDI